MYGAIDNFVADLRWFLVHSFLLAIAPWNVLFRKASLFSTFFWHDALHLAVDIIYYVVIYLTFFCNILLKIAMLGYLVQSESPLRKFSLHIKHFANKFTKKIVFVIRFVERINYIMGEIWQCCVFGLILRYNL